MGDLQNDALLREVDEALRHDRYMALWRRYGAAIGAGAVLMVAVVAGYQVWHQHMQDQRSAAAEAFAAASRQAATGTAAESAKAFEAIAQTGPAGYALISRFREAAALADAGERNRAIATYHAIADDSRVDDTYRNLALVLVALQEMAGGLQPQTAIGLRRLADGTGPWRFHARELVAADLVRGNERQQARDLYGALATDPGTPAGIRARARDMLAFLGA